jgi:hypothetical protein
MNRAERRSRTEAFIDSQLRIARAHDQVRDAAQPGRLKKRHAMDCGRPQCGLCGNPRHTGHKHAETMQELKFNDRFKQGILDMTAGREPVDDIYYGYAE